MKTGILTFEQHLGKKDVGSSRIRGKWIVDNWSHGEDMGEAELFKFGAKYDVVIFQKAYFVEYAKHFKGVKILDICDPDWLHWSYKFVEMIEECDAVSCSSLELAKAVSKFTDKPVYFVPDRVELKGLPEPKVHKGDTKTVVWYGYSHNFPILDSAVPGLAKLGLELIVISDGIYAPPTTQKIKFTNLPFSQHYLEDIQKGDVVINPKYNKGKWKYKSDNKTVIAQAVGMPVAHTMEELKELMTEEQRNKAVGEGLKRVGEGFDVKLSVVDYKDIIKEIMATK